MDLHPLIEVRKFLRGRYSEKNDVTGKNKIRPELLTAAASKMWKNRKFGRFMK